MIKAYVYVHYEPLETVDGNPPISVSILNWEMVSYMCKIKIFLKLEYQMAEDYKSMGYSKPKSGDCLLHLFLELDENLCFNQLQDIRK